MGVDVGKRLHVIIREHALKGQRALFIGSVSHFEDLTELAQRFSVDTCVVDSKPELHKVRDLQEKHEWVWIADYNESDSMKDISISETFRTVRVNRTAIIDEVSKLFHQHKLLIPPHTEKVDNGSYYKHIQSLTRIKHPYKERFIWAGNNEDHYLHAEVYCLLASKTHASPQIWVIDPQHTQDESLASIDLSELNQSSTFQILQQELDKKLLDFFYG
jgi:hypothetical protein